MNEYQLRQISWLNPPKEILPRSTSVQKMYDAYRNTDGAKAFIEGMNQKLNEVGIHFERNKFPYDVSRHIKHSCLWYKGNLSPNDVESYLERHGIIYITFFENPDELKSIKSISHYHIFHY